MIESAERPAEWCLLSIHSPGQKSVPGGIFLLDLEPNTLHVKITTDLDTFPPDVQEVLSVLEDAIEASAAAAGGADALSRFEDDWSHAFQLSERSPLAITDPAISIVQLFKEHVTRRAKPSSEAPLSYFDEEALRRAYEAVPFNSGVVVRVLLMLRDGSTSMKQLEQLVSHDAVLTAHVMRVANLALESSGSEIRTVSRALMHLGVDRVAFHIGALGMREAFVRQNLRSTWDHSLAAAQVARRFSRLAPQVEAQELTLLALVHDIGRSVLAGLGPTYFEAHDRLQAEGALPVEIERQLCGSTHADIGADLLASWGFPSDLVHAVETHHGPLPAGKRLNALLFLIESSLEQDEDCVDLAMRAQAIACVGSSLDRLVPTETGIKEGDLSLLRMSYAAR